MEEDRKEIDMVNLPLTNNEWYFLHRHLEKLINKNPHNHIPKNILDKLVENAPKLEDIKIDFKQEYECVFGEKRT